MNDILLTKESFEALNAELDFLKNNKMPEIVKRLEESIKLGDLRENGEYQSAKDDQGMVAGKIREIEEKLRSATIIEKSSDDCVAIGSKVTIIDSAGEEKDIEIVDQTQADPSQGKISNESPLGQAFIGHCSGESVKVSLPAGEKEYKIKSVK